MGMRQGRLDGEPYTRLAVYLKPPSPPPLIPSPIIRKRAHTALALYPLHSWTGSRYNICAAFKTGASGPQPVHLTSHQPTNPCKPHYTPASSLLPPSAQPSQAQPQLNEAFQLLVFSQLPCNCLCLLCTQCAHIEQHPLPCYLKNQAAQPASTTSHISFQHEHLSTLLHTLTPLHHTPHTHISLQPPRPASHSSQHGQDHTIKPLFSLS